MNQPSIGRIVRVPMDPAENNGSAIAPAVITRVWTDTLINVRILADGHDTPWRTSVEYVEQLPEQTDGQVPHVWTWPPMTTTTGGPMSDTPTPTQPETPEAPTPEPTPTDPEA